jgi:hypothetical protein
LASRTKYGCRTMKLLKCSRSAGAAAPSTPAWHVLEGGLRDWNSATDWLSDS